MIIYKATNTVNGKVYIGLTTNGFEYRKKSHKKNIEYERYQHVIFYKAINKYGWDSFNWEVIDHADTLEKLNEKEKYWINHYKSFVGFKDRNGYNSTLGGEGINGFTHSEKTREKLSKANLGRKMPNEFKEKLSKIHLKRIKENPHQVVRGEKASTSKLTDSQVTEIIKHLENKTYTIKELAEIYGVGRASIDNIKNGKRWTHIKRNGVIEIESYNTGLNHHSNKLTADNVIDIKKRLINGEKQIHLAEEFGIAQQSVRKIAIGKSWSHIKVQGEEVLKQKTIKHLDDETVIQIKRLLMNGVKQKDIAKQLNITPMRVSSIKTGEAYAHVEVEGFIPDKKYKLSEDDIRKIKILLNKGVSNTLIGKQFNVSNVLVSMIKLKKIHADI